MIAERITLTPGARALVQTMRKAGALTCLVSGGFTLFTKRIADMIGFDDNRGNTLAVAKDGTLEGVVGEPILGREGKLATLLDLTARLGIGLEDTMAVGDGANDLAMIEMSGLGVAYHAKPAVAASAHARIDHGDLTALLYMQGYKREEFARRLMLRPRASGARGAGPRQFPHASTGSRRASARGRARTPSDRNAAFPVFGGP